MVAGAAADERIIRIDATPVSHGRLSSYGVVLSTCSRLTLLTLIYAHSLLLRLQLLLSIANLAAAT